MTNKERLDNDFALNSENVLFTMMDDDFMGQRGKGFYAKDIVDDGHECRRFIFDNGHQYLLDMEENKLYVCDTVPREYFVHKHLERVLSDFVDQWSINESNIYCFENEVKAEPLIRLLPYREDGIVYLTNIVIPSVLKHKGLGKLLIKQIFEVCQRLNYRLILLNVVESFSNSLEKRNATFLDFETIEITNETKLN